MCIPFRTDVLQCGSADSNQLIISASIIHTTHKTSSSVQTHVHTKHTHTQRHAINDEFIKNHDRDFFSTAKE